MSNDQRSLKDQLTSLVALANKNGLYDAADYVKRAVDGMETSRRIHNAARKHGYNKTKSEGVVDLFEALKESLKEARHDTSKEKEERSPNE